MKKVLFLLLITIVFFSCSNKDTSKVYIYKEYTKTGMYDTKVIKQDTIYAANDTLAYEKAYETFTISNRVFNDMNLKAKERGVELPKDSKPHNFMLFDNNNNIISNKLTDIEKNQIESRIFNLK